jgi:hypothetical protein
LFINVFGNWVGSFGVNTSAGNPPSNVEQAALNQLNQTVENNASSNSSSTVSGASAGGQSNAVTQNNVASSSINGDTHNGISPTNSITDFKKPASLPLSTYLWPIFAVATLLIASVLYKFSKE